MSVRDRLEGWYYTLWGCRHGKHRMKMGGCRYCGGGGDKWRVVWR